MRREAPGHRCRRCAADRAPTISVDKWTVPLGGVLLTGVDHLMCGLAGVARFGGGMLSSESDALLAAMTRRVAHRGPDEQVTWRGGAVGLGFTRLALVAPDAGDQPLWTDDGSIVVIANGEVYNHRQLEQTLPSGTHMRTGSDCEVLGYLYRERGMKFLDDVNGMFAIVLHDVRRNRLVLARDRFGIKPLYFHRNNDRIVFASEMKALFADSATPRSVDWQASLGSPILQSAPVLNSTGPVTWFTGIEYVAPGTIVEIDLADGRTTTHSYWTFPGSAEPLSLSDEEATEEYGRLLAAAVADCATADAELGMFLSGGVDSAAVAALASRTTTLHTFTILNPSTVENGDSYYADLIARQYGFTNHQVYLPRQHHATVDEWRRHLWLLETPMAGPDSYLKQEMHRYARTVRPDLKGMLLGAASDEFNGGYSTDYAGGGDWTDFTTNLTGMARRGQDQYDPSRANWNEAMQAAVIRNPTDRGAGDDYLTYLRYEYQKVQQYNVWIEDRAAAGSGIEARVPFLDHRLVEFVTAIPPHQRRRLLWDKRILRDAVRDVLPVEVSEREKVPFVYGEGVQHTYRSVVRLLTQSGRALVDQALSTDGAREHIEGKTLHRLLDRMAGGEQLEVANLALRLVNLGLLDAMVADLPPAVIDQPVPAVLTAWPDSDFAADGGQGITSRILELPTADLNTVPVWSDDVLLVDAIDGSGQRFVAVNGVIEFVINDENKHWRDFVAVVDGDKTVGELLNAVGADYAAVAEPLGRVLDLGLLRMTSTEPADQSSELLSVAGYGSTAPVSA
ncbi:asparagine synthase (glutamine-hydrolyzing) [Actinoplanes sp. NPDC020271]|uniref:asparagine synthase (glutamine-hydrolyzing) n=1 Tax=Actinoplanes sp. NPDC020271 TaxID=3363896 RepID=UPI0037A65095